MKQGEEEASWYNRGVQADGHDAVRVVERLLTVRDDPPDHLRRVPGLKVILPSSLMSASLASKKNVHRLACRSLEEGALVRGKR
jgi:hypothetical protein